MKKAPVVILTLALLLGASVRGLAQKNPLSLIGKGAGTNIPQKNTGTVIQNIRFFIIYILLFYQIRPHGYLDPNRK